MKALYFRKLVYVIQSALHTWNFHLCILCVFCNVFISEMYFWQIYCIQKSKKVPFACFSHLLQISLSEIGWTGFESLFLQVLDKKIPVFFVLQNIYSSTSLSVLYQKNLSRINCLFVRGFSMKVKFQVTEVAACAVLEGLFPCVCRNHYVTLPVFWCSVVSSGMLCV